MNTVSGEKLTGVFFVDEVDAGLIHDTGAGLSNVTDEPRVVPDDGYGSPISTSTSIARHAAEVNAWVRSSGSR
jgi:hypothetical protein